MVGVGAPWWGVAVLSGAFGLVGAGVSQALGLLLGRQSRKGSLALQRDAMLQQHYVQYSDHAHHLAKVTRTPMLDFRADLDMLVAEHNQMLFLAPPVVLVASRAVIGAFGSVADATTVKAWVDARDEAVRALSQFTSAARRARGLEVDPAVG